MKKIRFGAVVEVPIDGSNFKGVIIDATNPKRPGVLLSFSQPSLRYVDVSEQKNAAGELVLAGLNVLANQDAGSASEQAA